MVNEEHAVFSKRKLEVFVAFTSKTKVNTVHTSSFCPMERLELLLLLGILIHYRLHYSV